MNAEKKALLKAARLYAKRGWRPFAVSSETNASVGIGWGFVRDSDRDPTDEELKEWFSYPAADSVAICTGKKTGVFGIDLDHKKGFDGVGALESEGIAVDDLLGPTFYSPNDGRHVLFNTSGFPDGPIPTCTGLLPGVDIKGDGSSIKLDGPGYTQDDRRNPSTMSLHPAPKKMRDLIVSNGGLLAVVEDDEELEEEDDFERGELGDAIPKDGYIADYVKHATKVTMVPPEFALIVALSQLSILMNGKVVVPGFGGKPTPPAIWAVLIGHPGSLKSSAIEYGLSMVDRVTKKRSIPAHTTPEALMEFLEKQNHGYLFHTELSGFMKKSAKRQHQAGDKELLNEIYDFKSVVERNTITGGIRKAHFPAVTLLGATTFNNFTEYAESNDIRGGFLARFVFVVQESRPKYRGLMDAGKGNSDRIVSELRDLYTLVKDAPTNGIQWKKWVYMSMDRDARVAFDQWDRMMREAEVDPVLAGLYERAGGIALRLTMSYALSRGELAISAEDVGHATALLDWVRSTSWPMIADIAGTGSYAGRQMLKVKQQTQRLMKKQAAKKGPHADWTDEWVNRRDVQQPCRIDKNQMVKWVESLVETGEMEERMAVGKSGRKVTQIRLTRRGWVTDHEAPVV